jgi:DNA-binding HxlR family transcriptional regulator
MPKSVAGRIKPNNIPKSVANAVLLMPQRRAMTENCICFIESARDDFFPGIPIWEAFMLIVVLFHLFKINEAGRAATATELARATGIPQTTMHRKLAYLKKKGFIERLGSRFVLLPEQVNQPHMLRGFWSRLHKVRDWPKKVADSTLS